VSFASTHRLTPQSQVHHPRIGRKKSGYFYLTIVQQRKNSRLLQAQEEVFSLSQDTVAALLSQVLKHISASDITAPVDWTGGLYACAESVRQWSSGTVLRRRSE
jgi:hypothetical protein